MLRLFTYVTLLCSMHAAVFAESSWPEFRGPSGQGISSEKNLPLTWSESENIRWKTPIQGSGWSSPVVVDGKIWLTTATIVKATQEEIAAKTASDPMPDQMTAARSITLWVVEIDLESGSVLRSIEILTVDDPPIIHSLNSYASPTPILADGKLYCHFGDYGTICLDTATGKTLWHKRFPLDHRVGPGSSPLLWNDLLIIPCDGADVQYILALNKDTGETVWKTDRPPIRQTDGDFRKSYSTPLMITVNDEEQIVIPGAQWCVAYEPRTGKAIWWVDHDHGFSIVPRPVFDGKLLYYCTGFMSDRLLAIRPDGEGDVTDTHIAWEKNKQVPTMPSPLVVDGRMYMVSDEGIASCFDAETGEQKWRERLKGRFSSSPLYAEGRIYIGSHEGVTMVYKAADEFEILAENQLDGQIMASPVPIDGTLLVRAGEHLYRIGK